MRDAQGIGALDMNEGDKGAARRFLLSDVQPWRNSRNEVADLAGLDGDYVRDRAERCLRPMIDRERKLARGADYAKAWRRRRKSGSEPESEHGRRVAEGHALSRTQTPEQRREYQRLRVLASARAYRARRAAQWSGKQAVPARGRPSLVSGAVQGRLIG